MEREKKMGTYTRKKMLSKQKFLKAVGTILRKEGYQKLGVNRVAEVAGIDKSSLYYHFGNFDNLLEQYVLANDYWLNTFKDPLDDHTDIMEQGKKMILDQFDSLMGSEEMQAILLWELSEKKGIPKYIAELREEMGADIISKFNGYFQDSDIDFEMLAALMISGIYYLVLHRNQSRFCNIDVCNPEHVDRLKHVINGIIKYMVQNAHHKDQNEQA